MEKLMSILKENFPTIDFEKEKKLVSSGVLDSIQVVDLISDIEDTFGISITMEYIQPSYFESAETMWDMIQELI